MFDQVAKLISQHQTVSKFEHLFDQAKSAAHQQKDNIELKIVPTVSSIMENIIKQLQKLRTHIEIVFSKIMNENSEMLEQFNSESLHSIHISSSNAMSQLFSGIFNVQNNNILKELQNLQLIIIKQEIEKKKKILKLGINRQIFSFGANETNKRAHQRQGSSQDMKTQFPEVNQFQLVRTLRQLHSSRESQSKMILYSQNYTDSFSQRSGRISAMSRSTTCVPNDQINQHYFRYDNSEEDIRINQNNL